MDHRLLRNHQVLRHGTHANSSGAALEVGYATLQLQDGPSP
jgi:hypothetical protein